MQPGTERQGIRRSRMSRERSCYEAHFTYSRQSVPIRSASTRFGSCPSNRTIGCFLWEQLLTSYREISINLISPRKCADRDVEVAFGPSG